jgi:uncharacterized protein
MDMAPTLSDRAAARLAGFASFLHANGFGIGGGDVLAVLHAAQKVGVLDPQVLRLSLQALLCGRSDEWRRFDELFDAWFLPANRWQRPEAREAAPGRSAAAVASPSANPQADDDDESPRLDASRDETTSSTDFGELTQREHTLDI